MLPTRAVLTVALAVAPAALPALAWADDDVITLGAPISMTGIYSTLGKDTRDGYDLGVKKINDAGGVEIGGKHYKLKITYYDDESTPARSAQLAERLMAQDGIKLLLGPYGSGLTKAVQPIVEKFQVPMVQANGADRDIFTKGYKFTFGVLATTEQYLRPAVDLLADLAKAQGKPLSDLKVAVAIENDPFSIDVRDGVVEDAKDKGMKVVVDDKFPRDLNDMSTTITKIKALKPDLLLVSGHEKGAALAVRSLADAKLALPMVAMTHCDSAKVEQQGKAAEYVVCGSQWDRTLTYKDALFGSAEDYAKTFEAEYHYAPPYQSAESTAAVMVYADALHRAGSADPLKVRDALATTDMQTFYGPIKIDQTGRNVAKTMVLQQIQGGAYKVVAPAQWASAKVVYPAPAWSAR